MDKRIGSFVIQKTSAEEFKAYVPSQLPPDPAVDLEKLYPWLERATAALAELNAVQKTIPNTSLFVYMYICKEALLSSQIEGTQSSFSDLILFEQYQEPEVLLEDVEEVSNYLKALNYGLERIKGGFPLSLRLIKEIHGFLLAGTRGAQKLPGELRRSQNWIGGTRPGNALFVPPPVEFLNECLSDFEVFLHSKSLPGLIKVGLIHVQFETIHPFLDGNGRLGRLLITLLLCHDGFLDQPILYLSLYLKQNRQIYYNLLQEVRFEGNWEAWLEFFLDGVAKTAQQGVQTTLELNDLFFKDSIKIDTLGRARSTCAQVFEYLKKLPQVTAPLIAKELGLTPPTARNALKNLLDLNIVQEISGKKRDKVYVYRNYLQILEAGTEPFKPGF